MDIDALKAGLYAVVQAEVPTMVCEDNPLRMPGDTPAFVVFDFDIVPHGTMRFFSELDLTARLIVGRGDPDTGGKLTRGYMGDGLGTVFYAIEKPHILATGQQTLNGACTQAYVSRIRGYRQYIYGSTPFIGCEFVIHCVGERATP